MNAFRQRSTPFIQIENAATRIPSAKPGLDFEDDAIHAAESIRAFFPLFVRGDDEQIPGFQFYQHHTLPSVRKYVMLKSVHAETMGVAVVQKRPIRGFR